MSDENHGRTNQREAYKSKTAEQMLSRFHLRHLIDAALFNREFTTGCYKSQGNPKLALV